MLSEFKLNDRTFKNIINLTFLTLSSFLIVYFLIQLTDNPYFKVGFGLFAIILEVFMQYLLATGRGKWKIGLKYQAGILFFCYALYVLVYAVPSATGFFMAEINKQEQMSARMEIVDDTSKQRLGQINSTIINLNAQLATESKSGYGKKSQLIMDEIKKLTAEQTSLQSQFQNTAVVNTPNTKDLFKILGDVFKIPGSIFKIIIFGISVLMVYVGLIITSWDIQVAAVFESSEMKTSETRQTIGTNDLKMLDTPRQEQITCPDWGKGFSHRQDNTFCNAYCQLAAHRNKSPVNEVN